MADKTVPSPSHSRKHSNKQTSDSKDKTIPSTQTLSSPNQSARGQLLPSWNSPTSKPEIRLVGYILYVTDALKGQYFKVQFQESDDARQFNVYDFVTFMVHFHTALKTVVNVKHNRSDSSLYLGYNKRNTRKKEVNFSLNGDLKSFRSKAMIIKDLLLMDVQKNKNNKLSIKVLITLGNGDFIGIWYMRNQRRHPC